jgi:hypothetical protein
MSTCLKFILPKRTFRKKLACIKQPIKYLNHLFGCYPKAFKNNEENLGGLFDILDGLEYHYKKHLMYEKRASRGLSCRGACHEATAYLCRLGQLYTLFCSKWFKVYVEDVKGVIPSICALIPIRNKFAAHRQQDSPSKYNDDCKSLGLQCFGLLPGLSKKILPGEELEILKDSLISRKDCKIVYQFPTKQRYCLKDSPAVVGIEYLNEVNNIIQFTPSENHPAIIKESLCLIEMFLVAVESKDKLSC